MVAYVKNSPDKVRILITRVSNLLTQVTKALTKVREMLTNVMEYITLADIMPDKVRMMMC